MSATHDELYKEVEEATKLLPAWFVGRMMTDSWTFGLALVSGSMLVISNIDAVTQAADGSMWLDVHLHQGSPDDERGRLYAPTSRLEASVAVAHILYAVELADT